MGNTKPRGLRPRGFVYLIVHTRNSLFDIPLSDIPYPDTSYSFHYVPRRIATPRLACPFTIIQFVAVPTCVGEERSIRSF